MNKKPVIPLQPFIPNRPFQPTPQKRPIIPAPYPNKTDDVSIKNLFGKLLSGSLGEITDFINSNKLTINNIRDANNDSPLHFVIKDPRITPDQKLEICTYLISKGANISSYDANDETPLLLSSKLQLNNILELLISKGATLDVLNNMKQNALHLAVQPYVKACPSFRSSSLIPQPEIKFRDINNISRALWQHLNDYFKVGNFPAIGLQYEPLHYPLRAIKNIIDNSNTYLRINVDKSKLPPDKDYIETQKENIMSELQKIISTSTFTVKDKKFKTTSTINDTIKKNVTEINNYFKDSNTELKLENNDSFGNDDITNEILKLTYFSSNPIDKDIFSLNNINFNQAFEQLFSSLTTKYNSEIGTLSTIFNDYYTSIGDIYDNIRKLHTVNISNVTENLQQNIGNHQTLYNNPDIINKYENKYQLHIQTLHEHINDFIYHYPSDPDYKEYFLKDEFIEMLKIMANESTDESTDESTGEPIITHVLEPKDNTNYHKFTTSLGIECINTGSYINLVKNDDDTSYSLETHYRSNVGPAPDYNIEGQDHTTKLYNTFGYLITQFPYPKEIYNIEPLPEISPLNESQNISKNKIYNDLISTSPSSLETILGGDAVLIGIDTLDNVPPPRISTSTIDKVYNALVNPVGGPGPNNTALSSIMVPLDPAFNANPIQPVYLEFINGRIRLFSTLNRLNLFSQGPVLIQPFDYVALANTAVPPVPSLATRTTVPPDNLLALPPQQAQTDYRNLMIRIGVAPTTYGPLNPGTDIPTITAVLTAIRSDQERIQFIEDIRLQTQIFVRLAERYNIAINNQITRTQESLTRTTEQLTALGAPIQQTQPRITSLNQFVVELNRQIGELNDLLAQSNGFLSNARILSNNMVLGLELLIPDNPPAGRPLVARTPIDPLINQNIEDVLSRVISTHLINVNPQFVNETTQYAELAAQHAGYAFARAMFDLKNYPEYGKYTDETKINIATRCAMYAANEVIARRPTFAGQDVTEIRNQLKTEYDNFLINNLLQVAIRYKTHILFESLTVLPGQPNNNIINMSINIVESEIEPETKDLFFVYSQSNGEENVERKIPLKYKHTYDSNNVYQDSSKVIFENYDQADIAKGIKIKLVINIKKSEYYTTSALFSFFKVYYAGMEKQLENNFKMFLNADDELKKIKYNYYSMYHLMNQINFNIDEFTSYYLFLLNNESKEGLNKEHYDQFNVMPNKLKKYVNDIMDSIKKDSDKIKKQNEQVNKSVNIIVSILNAHQTLLINYAFVRKLLTITPAINTTLTTNPAPPFAPLPVVQAYLDGRLNFIKNYPQYDPNNYTLSFKEIITVSGNVIATENHKIVGIFNKPMKKLPHIDYDNAQQIDEQFFSQSHPIIDPDMEFIIDDYAVPDNNFNNIDPYTVGQLIIDDNRFKYIEELQKNIDQTLPEPEKIDLLKSIIIASMAPDIVKNDIDEILRLIQFGLTLYFIRFFNNLGGTFGYNHYYDGTAATNLQDLGFLYGPQLSPTTFPLLPIPLQIQRIPLPTGPPEGIFNLNNKTQDDVINNIIKYDPDKKFKNPDGSPNYEAIHHFKDWINRIVYPVINRDTIDDFNPAPIGVFPYGSTLADRQNLEKNSLLYIINELKFLKIFMPTADATTSFLVGGNNIINYLNGLPSMSPRKAALNLSKILIQTFSAGIGIRPINQKMTEIESYVRTQIQAAGALTYDGLKITIENLHKDKTANREKPLRTHPGRLLMVPYAEKIDVPYDNNLSIFRGNDKQQNSLLIKERYFMKNDGRPLQNFVRYDDIINPLNVPNDTFGIIGVREFIPGQVDSINLLDPSRLPFDLTNSYNEMYVKQYASYGDIIINLKRVFITMVLDTRREIIYLNQGPSKKPYYVFGYQSAQYTNLYDYIMDAVKKQLGTLENISGNMNIKSLVNRLIAKGVDNILNKNIDSYYNSAATKIQKEILDDIKTIDVSLLNIQTLPEIKFGVNFSDLNETLYDTILNDEDDDIINTSAYNIINTKLLLMEDQTVDIQKSEYNVSNKGNDEIKKKKIHYKNDYYNMDESIINPVGLQCLSNDLKVVKTLVNRGINMNHPDIYGNLPITYAIESRNYDIVHELLDKTNLFYRNTNNNDILMNALLHEQTHQNILIKNEKLVYSEVYKDIMMTIFETNDELKKNLPKNIEIVNYFPLFILNNIWYSLLGSSFASLENLFYKYVNPTIKNDPEYSASKMDLFMFSNNNRKIYNYLNTNVDTFVEDFGYKQKVAKIDTKIKHYDDMLLSITGAKRTNILNRKTKLEETKTKLERLVSQIKPTTSPQITTLGNPPITPNGATYNLDTMLTTINGILSNGAIAVNLKSDFRNSIIDILNKLDAPQITIPVNGVPTPTNLYEMKDFILGSVIKNYNKQGEVVRRIENIHLYISNIYSKILEQIVLEIHNISLVRSINNNLVNMETHYHSLKTIESYLERLCKYLDQRYMESNNVDINNINNDIYKSITITSMIVIQNSYLLTIKKALINHIIRVYGVNKIDQYRYVINYLMGTINYGSADVTALFPLGPPIGLEEPTLLFSDKLDDKLDDLLNDKVDVTNSENITATYVKEVLNFNNSDDDQVNEEYVGYDKIIQEIRRKLINNPFIRVKEDSNFIKEYDENIVPYYKSLYKNIVEHEKKLVLNYIKFIMNQYDGIKIVTRILYKVL